MFFNKDKDEVFRILGVVGSFSFTATGAMAGGYFLGNYVDKKLNTAPWFMLSFVLLGVAGSFIEFFKLVRKLSK
ncbi:MAG: AtpZ/AtpI family protein [Planctomycetes bacterium]|nr:AtpZ/AtpI family protein [Planctomycetota bacterium]